MFLGYLLTVVIPVTQEDICTGKVVGMLNTKLVYDAISENRLNFIKKNQLAKNRSLLA